MARDHSTRRYADKGGPGSGMHLFDFNQTLSGKRLSDERKIAPDDRLYKGRGSPNSRAKNEEGDIFLSTLRTSDKKMNYVHGGNEYAQAHGGRDTVRAPNVVARLMGLDTIPNEALPVTRAQSQAQAKKKWGDQLVAKQAMEKPSRKKNEFKQSTVVAPADDKARLYHSRHSEDRRQGSPKELPDLFELEEMKRQLALKQMLVREKLNEAKRLLTGERISDKRWVAANQKLNQSKEFLDAIDFFQTNRDAFLSYVDDQDSVLGKHIEKVPSNVQRHSPTLRPVPEGLRNPIVRKVIESRREDARKNNFATGEDTIKNLVSDNQAPTRIVVLKPSPNRSFSPTPATFSPGPYIDLRDEGVIPSRRVTDVSRDDEGTANPREIAKEIARQVRESVVRDLARNASGCLAEQGASKRLNVPLDNSEGPRLDGGCDYFGDEAVTTPMGKGPRKQKAQAELVEDTVRRISHSSSQKKPSRPRQQVSESSLPLSRPASKGIVVLVPDQSVSKIQSREIVSPSSTIKQPIKKDRIRRSQQVLPETSHKLGDSFRKVKSQPHEINKRKDVEFANRDLTNSVKDDKVGEYDSHSESIGVAAYGGSFLLKSAGFESQGENECSDSKDTLESEYTADVCVSETRSPVETDISKSPEEISSNGNLHDECVSRLEEDLSSTNQVSPETSGWRDVGSEQNFSQVSQEAELTKESPTTTDVVEAVDPDEASLGSDNSGQPSPISVLESSFEDSPGHVDFNTISSELEELRSHLRRLKWDDNDDEDLDGLQETSDAVLDKEIVAEVPGQQELKLSSSNNTSELQWLQLERCDAKAKEDEQKVYVKNILLASGLIRNSDWSDFLVEQHSLSHALDPMLFEQLEGFYRTQSDRNDTAKASRLDRRLLFDMVDEILSHKRVCDPWLATVRTVPGGGFLLREVWSKLSNFFEFPQGEDLQHTVENLIERYLTKGDRWMEITIFVEAVGVEMENELMDELFQECIAKFL